MHGSEGRCELITLWWRRTRDDVISSCWPCLKCGHANHRVRLLIMVSCFINSARIFLKNLLREHFLSGWHSFLWNIILDISVEKQYSSVIDHLQTIILCKRWRTTAIIWIISRGSLFLSLLVLQFDTTYSFLIAILWFIWRLNIFRRLLLKHLLQLLDVLRITTIQLHHFITLRVLIIILILSRIIIDETQIRDVQGSMQSIFSFGFSGRGTY